MAPGVWARIQGLVGAAALLTGCPDYNVSRIKLSDVYTQATPAAPVDVLWVVDSSATMSEEQAALAENFDAFAAVLFQTDVDFRLGVTTTDVEAQGGALVGPVLDPDTEDLSGEFAAQAAVGIGGAREEQPLEAARLAAQGAASELFRDEAAFQLIIATDEDDQSPDEVETYAGAYAAARPSGIVRVSALAGGLPEGCASPDASAEPAERVVTLVALTGGSFKSICEPAFAPVMKSLAFGVTGMTDTFALAALPALDSMTVSVDLVDLYRRPHDGWQYNAADNTVVLDGAAVPRAGQTVRIDYYEIYADEAEDAAQ